MKTLCIALITIFLEVFLSISVSIGNTNIATMQPTPSPSAVLIYVKGDVKVFSGKDKSSSWNKGAGGIFVYDGDSIETKDDSLAILLLKDKSTIKIHPHTSLTLISTFLKNPSINEPSQIPNTIAQPVNIPAKPSDISTKSTISTKFKLFWGNIWAKVEKSLQTQSIFEVETPNSSAAVHGTAFEVIVLPSETDDVDKSANNTDSQSKIESRVNVWEGTVSVKTNKQPDNLTSQQSIVLNRYGNARVSQSHLVVLPALSQTNVSYWQSWNLQVDLKLENQNLQINQNLNDYIDKIPSGKPPSRLLLQEIRSMIPNPPKIEVHPRTKLPNNPNPFYNTRNNDNPSQKSIHYSRTIKPLIPQTTPQKNNTHNIRSKQTKSRSDLLTSPKPNKPQNRQTSPSQASPQKHQLPTSSTPHQGPPGGNVPAPVKGNVSAPTTIRR